MKRYFPVARLVAVISLLLNAIWLSPAEAAGYPQILSLGELRQNLAAPGAIDVDSRGNLYVADAVSQKVLKFDVYGRFKAAFATVPATGAGLAVSADGQTLYVAVGQSVALLDARTGSLKGYVSGAPQVAGQEFAAAGEIDLDASGYVFVADPSQKKVNVYYPDGTYKSQFGGVGTAAGQFLSIDALTVNAAAGQVLVADGSATNEKVHVFTTNGALVRTLATASAFGGTATPLMSPRGIAVDSLGRLYFGEFIKSYVHVMDGATYLSLGVFKQPGYEVGQLNNVEDLAFDATTGRLYVSCTSGRIEIFGIDGGTSPVFVNHAPTAAVPQSPVGGSAVATLVPELSFAEATDADEDALRYEVKVLNAGASIYQGETTTTAVTVGTGVLAENGAYSWTVQAFDTEGAGSALATASFVVNTVNDPPAAPVLVSPLSGEVLAGAGVLSWEAAADPDPVATQVSYLVEVAADATFSPVVLSGTFSGTSVPLTGFAGYAGLVDGAGYVWRVTALDSEGAASAPGAVGRFVYDTTVLKVTANMPGAMVSLTGNHAYPGSAVGVAPLELRDLEPGRFSVVVERDGFEPYVTQVNLVAGGNVEINVRLVAARVPGVYRLTSTLPVSASGAAAPFVVDFDNDGKLDLLVGDTTGQLRLHSGLQRSATNVFTCVSSQSLGLPVMPGAVPFAADWDNDGRKDLLVGQADGSVKLYLNIGQEEAPAFGAAQYVMANGSALNVVKNAAPAVVDLNGDGVKDLVVGNGLGQVQVFWNQGSDEAPQLASGVALFAVTGAAVPMPVDWDADGDRDLLVTAAGVVKAYLNDLAGTGVFTAVPVLSVTRFASVFPLDIDGTKGKDLLIGQTDNRVTYWAGGSLTFVASLQPALVAKVAEIQTLVEAAEPAKLSQVETIRAYVQLGKFDLAQYYAKILAGQLQDAAAKAAVNELVVILTK